MHRVLVAAALLAAIPLSSSRAQQDVAPVATAELGRPDRQALVAGFDRPIEFREHLAHEGARWPHEGARRGPVRRTLIGTAVGALVGGVAMGIAGARDCEENDSDWPCSFAVLTWATMGVVGGAVIGGVIGSLFPERQSAGGAETPR